MEFEPVLEGAEFEFFFEGSEYRSTFDGKILRLSTESINLQVPYTVDLERKCIEIRSIESFIGLLNALKKVEKKWKKLKEIDEKSSEN